MGAGRIPVISLSGEDEATWISIPDDLLIPIVEDPVAAVVSDTFPPLTDRINNVEELCIMCHVEFLIT
ncbi:hypothetical protein L1987_09481 [Smallanthus sonchifolius]|uniref:Uncharacterized protein n=1 Tax=Smallanthus sonchifolius TaxID=185202 RepID=A0ACB9JPK4_9ASTR|nr:hypothetical protein L1987_09481 [Smallanthus sonchifolius]